VLARIAVRVLAMPSSNAFQESVFSTATYVNTQHRRSTKPATLERNVLLKCNYQFIQGALTSDEEFARSFTDKDTLKRLRASSSGGASGLAESMQPASKRQIIELVQSDCDDDDE
jgi:hypothetical protein